MPGTRPGMTGDWHGERNQPACERLSHSGRSRFREIATASAPAAADFAGRQIAAHSVAVGPAAVLAAVRLAAPVVADLAAAVGLVAAVAVRRPAAWAGPARLVLERAAGPAVVADQPEVPPLAGYRPGSASVVLPAWGRALAAPSGSILGRKSAGYRRFDAVGKPGQNRGNTARTDSPHRKGRPSP